MRKLLGLLIVPASFTACAGQPSDDAPSDDAQEEVIESTSSALTTSIAGTSLTAVRGNQSNTTILGVPVRAFWTDGEAEAWVYLETGGTHSVVFDMAATECQGYQAFPTATFVGSGVVTSGSGYPSNARVTFRLTARAPGAGWQRVRVGAANDRYVPGVCDANLYIFNVTVN